SMYWAIVTLTTVGYGDIAPVTILGQILACTVMILGYGIIAVPTGIVSVEMHKATIAHSHLKNCNNCGAKGHEEDAAYCKLCGTKLSVIKLEKDMNRLNL
ncbi:MAG: potassium channel family protein, partial [Candidatus Obscuribacterales bacterium]|nr:potassium channel family protein [Candidatus Obscuribacterales bacterium]